MRRSTRILAVLVLGWTFVTGASAFVFLGASGTFWLVAHETRIATVVWPMLGVVFVAGWALLIAVHLYARELLGEAIAE